MTEDDNTPVDVTTATNDGGYGKPTEQPWSQHDYHHPAAGWGAAVSVGRVLISEREVIKGARATLTMNQEDGGFDCPGCAWPDTKGLKLDICGNGIKHVTWEMTGKKVGRDFFARHR